MRTNILLKLMPILGVLTQIVYSHDRFHNRLRSPSRNPNQIFNFQYGLQHQLYPQNYYKDLNYHRNNYNKRYRKRPKFPPRPRSAECCPCSKSGMYILTYLCTDSAQRCILCHRKWQISKYLASGSGRISFCIDIGGILKGDGVVWVSQIL